MDSCAAASAGTGGPPSWPRSRTAARRSAWNTHAPGSPALALRVCLRVFPGSPFLRWRYTLRAEGPATLTKSTGSDNLLYFALTLPAWAGQLSEIQLSQFEPVLHSYLPGLETRPLAEPAAGRNPARADPGLAWRAAQPAGSLRARRGPSPVVSDVHASARSGGPAPGTARAAGQLLRRAALGLGRRLGLALVGAGHAAGRVGDALGPLPCIHAGGNQSPPGFAPEPDLLQFLELPGAQSPLPRAPLPRIDEPQRACWPKSTRPIRSGSTCL